MNGKWPFKNQFSKRPDFGQAYPFATKQIDWTELINITIYYTVWKESSLPIPPDVLVVQDTNLMKLSTTIATFDKRFQLQKIIFIFFELIFSNDTVQKETRLVRNIINYSGVTEYRTFEYRKHWNTKHFEGRMSNGFGQNGNHFVQNHSKAGTFNNWPTFNHLKSELVQFSDLHCNLFLWKMK